MSQPTLFDLPGLDELTSSQAEFPANPTRSQGSNSELTTHEHSGRRCIALLDSSDPLMWLWKTLLVSSQWHSTACYLTWKDSVTPEGRLYFRLVPRMRPTDEIVCSLWPTPRAIYGEHPGMTDRKHLTGAAQLWPTASASDATRGDCESERNRRSPHLVSAVKMWPTPRAGDGDHGGPNSRDSKGKPALSAAVAMWPTPKSRDFRSASGDAGFQRDSPDLNVSVHMWSTPAANDAKNATLPPASEHWDSLPGDLKRSGAKGSLNPAWVEMLQGVPIGWTDIDTPETEAERQRQPAPWPAYLGQPQYEDEPPRVAQGVKNRVARLKALGNAVVPAQAAPIFAAIAAHAQAREESRA